MTIIPIYNIDDANELADKIHKRLERDREGYAEQTEKWQEFSGEPPYWLEVPPEILLFEMMEIINNL